jgi:ubiquinone/menaquinone biosynthesis C-methylase UbiE
MAQIHNPSSNNTFVPRQALAPTPQLYDELVGDGMQKLAMATVAEMACMKKGSVILDVGCGTGAGTAAVAGSVSNDVLSTLSIKAVDTSAASLDLYRQKTTKNVWPAQAVLADAGNLAAVFPDCTFTHVIGTAILFVVPEDGIPAMKEMIRVLKPGGIAALNTWCYVPNMDPVRIASQKTRPPGTPEIRGGMDKWSDPEFLKSAILKAGFSSNKVALVQRDVYCHATELDHYANMLWSFIGGTTSVGWFQSDEENWNEAIKIVKEELIRTDGFKLLEGGRVRLKFIANIAVVTK